MCTLLKVANRRPIDLISPLLVQEEWITSVESTGDNSAALARFSCAVHAFSASSAFFTRFLHFWPFAVRAAPRTRWCSSAPRRSASANAAQTWSAKNADYLPTSSVYPVLRFTNELIASSMIGNNFFHSLPSFISCMVHLSIFPITAFILSTIPCVWR